MSKDELRATCAVLEQIIVDDIARMKELQKAAEIERKEMPPTLVEVWRRSLGEEGEGIPALKAYESKREKLEAMNAELARRGCPTMNIEAALKAHN